jgi:hypothetical protein
VAHKALGKRQIVQVAKLLQPHEGGFDLVRRVPAPPELALHLGA